MKVVLIEFIDEFQVFRGFLEKKNIRLDDFVIIALQPRIQAYLSDHGIQYRNTLPYFNNESHKRIITETEKIMSHIRTYFNFDDTNGLRNCYELEFSSYVRLFLNHILKILEILENIYRHDLNVELFAFVRHEQNGSLMIDESERYVGELARRFAKPRGIKFTNIKDGTTVKREKRTYKKRPLWIEKNIMKVLLFLLRNKKAIFVSVGGRLFKELLTEVFEKDRKAVFLAIGHSRGFWESTFFNIHSILRSIVDSRYCPYYLISIDGFYHVNENELSKLMITIDSIVEPRPDIFEYKGLNYYDLVLNKIDRALKPHLSRMLSQSHYLNYMFSMFHEWMVMSFSALGIMAAAGELSRKMGHHSLFISHGAHPVPSDSYHEIELSNLCRGFMLGDYTHIALSTPVQEDHLHYFKNKYPNLSNTELKTGPLIFANVNGTHKDSSKSKLGISTDQVVLTHAITQKYRNSERFYFIETLDESFSSMSDLIRVVDQIGGVTLIFRIHPGFHMSNCEISTLLPKSTNYIINRDNPFSEVLAATDVLISYSSTVVDEALINKVPVVFYDKWNRYNHFALKPFSESDHSRLLPVCYLNNENKLFDALSRVINAVSATKKEDIDVSKYCYKKNYRDNLFEFLKSDWS